MPAAITVIPRPRPAGRHRAPAAPLWRRATATTRDTVTTIGLLAAITVTLLLSGWLTGWVVLS